MAAAVGSEMMSKVHNVYEEKHNILKYGVYKNMWYIT